MCVKVKKDNIQGIVNSHLEWGGDQADSDLDDGNFIKDK